MSTRFRRLSQSLDSNVLILLVLFVIAYASMLVAAWPALTLPTGALLLFGGVAYLALILRGAGYVERAGGRAILIAYFAALILLCIAIGYASRASGGFWLLLLPLAILGVTMLPIAGLVAVCLALMLVFALSISLAGSAASVVAAATATFLPAVLFTVIYAHLLLRQRQALAAVEHLNAELAAANRQLGAYAAQAEELAITKERNRLAREIHDSLGHFLTAINIQIEAARAVVDSDRARTMDALAKAQGLTRNGLAEVRRSVAALRAAPTENRPLPEVLATLVGECRASGLVADLQIAGAPRVLAPPAELTLYRAAQEGLTNVRKHALASAVGVTLDYTALAAIAVTVADNGVGAASNGSGFGLLGLRERVQLVGGRMTTETARGQGFTLRVEVPG